MDLDECKFLPTAFLAKDWFWCQYGDGSGSLRSPDGKHLFIYDLVPYHAEGGNSTFWMGCFLGYI